MDGPTQHQKLTVDREYITRASRTLAVMTLVRQAAANEVAVPSRSESVKWINEAELDERWMDGQSLLFVFWCIWCRRGGVVATVSNSAQTPEEGCNLQDIKARILLVRTGRAASWKSDCPFLVKVTCNPGHGTSIHDDRQHDDLLLLHTRDGVNVMGDFHMSPKFGTAELERLV